ncbi:MAG: FtsH protease activity modulator HflK [Caldilineaceae bacterium]|nr:FtsH protease activity modulator HflK [Caldilineaceae bacterium]
MLNKPGPGGGNDLPPLTEYVDTLSGWASRRRGGVTLLILLAVLLLWLATGIYSVQPGEEGVVRTFGRFTSISTSGLNYRLPSPIQQVTIVDVSSIRRAEIGFRSSATQRQDILGEALMLTADENIVKVELLVQYRIANSRDFVFNVQIPEDVLLTSAEVALRDTVGKMTIDAVITEERARVQDQTRVILAQLMESYGTGIQITDVRLQGADPPEEVSDAFQEVVRALADKERLINESEAYQNDIVPRARGNKQKLIEEAEAFKQQRVLRATGDAERFLSILGAYRLAPEVTRERMHIEALEDVLQQVQLTLLDADAVGGQVLPFLPLKGLDGSVPPTSAPGTTDTPPQGE